MWGSDANVFGHTDPNLVLGGPIATYAQQAQAAALGIVVFAIVVLGLRAALSSFVPMSNHVATELVEGVAGALILAGAFVLLAPRLLGWLNDALHEIGDVDFSHMFQADATGPNAFVFALLALVVLFFAGKLVVRVLYRTALLAILYPVGIVALLLRAIPQLRWVSGWWARLWFGWLVAQVPSAMALVIGVQLFAFGAGQRRGRTGDDRAAAARLRRLRHLRLGVFCSRGWHPIGEFRTSAARSARRQWSDPRGYRRRASRVIGRRQAADPPGPAAPTSTSWRHPNGCKHSGTASRRSAWRSPRPSSVSTSWRWSRSAWRPRSASSTTPSCRS